MAFQIPCLVFLLILLVESKGAAVTCKDATAIFDKEVNMCCDKCPPGFHVKSKCSQNTQTVCEPCSRSEWLEGYNYHHNCFRCTKCDKQYGLMYAQNCTAQMDAKCICQAGKFCTSGYKDPYCSECRSYTLCKPGYGVIDAGTATRNVKCGACPSGTFSDEKSYTQKCRSHSKCGSGGILREGNSTSDTVCRYDMVDSGRTATTSTQGTTLRLSTTQQGQDLKPSTAPHTTGLPRPTGLQSAIPVPSSTGTPSKTIFTGPLVGVTVAGIIVLVVLAIFCLRRKEGSTEKETKVENGCVKAGLLHFPGQSECQLLLNHNGPAEPTISLSEKPSVGPSSVTSVGHNGVSSCYVNQDDVRVNLPQSPTVHQVVNLNLNIVAPASAAPAAPLTPCGASTPRPNGRPSEPDSELPLSQEEVDVSCQAEQGKETHTAVPETGRFVC